MLLTERRRKIVEIVEAEDNISNRDLSQRLDVSEMTIWRDLRELEEQGLVQRVRGGVSKGRISDVREAQFDTKQNVHSKEKDAIARYAAQHFVSDGEIIVLEGGTTVASMVPY